MFWQRALNSSMGYMYSKVCQSSHNLSTKVLKDFNQKPPVQYLNLIKHYLGTIFVHGGDVAAKWIVSETMNMHVMGSSLSTASWLTT